MGIAAGRLRRVVSLAALAFALHAHAAPDEADHGRDAGYPSGTRANWTRRDHLVGALTGMDGLFEGVVVKAPEQARALPAAGPPFEWPAIESYLASQPVTGLLIVKDGRVVVERYQYERGPAHRFTSFSMAKTLVGLAVGLAIADGRIGSIDDPLDRYAPGLADSAWRGVSFRHALTMSSGVRFTEDYERADSGNARLYAAWSRRRGDLLEAMQSFRERDDPAGTRFHYISADTVALTLALRGALGASTAGSAGGPSNDSVADFISTRIWQPIGAEADAFWITDAAAVAAGHCCFSAHLRDWARLGAMLADGGRVEGQQVIPAEWLAAATTVRPQDGHLQPRRATPSYGYGYQTWVLPDGLGFALLGIHGQAIHVLPRLKLVMVQMAAWPRAQDIERSRARHDFWRALVRRAESGP